MARQHLGAVVPGLLETLTGEALTFRWNGPTADRIWNALDRQAAWTDQSRQLMAFGAAAVPPRLVETVFRTTRAQPDRIAEALRGGLGIAWLNLDEVEPVLGLIADQVERVLGVRTRFDVAILPASKIDLWDDGHVTVVVPLDGPVWCATPGGASSLLHVGEGALIGGHELSAVDGPTLIVLARTPPVTSVSSALDAILPLAYRQALLRADLPSDRSKAVVSYGGSVATDRELRAAEIDQLVTPENMGRALAHHLAHLPPRFASSFGLSLKLLQGDSVDWWVRCPLVAGFGVRLLPTGEADLVGAAQSARLEPLWANALAQLSDGVTMSLASLFDNHGERHRSSLEACVRWSVSNGWLELVDVG